MWRIESGMSLAASERRSHGRGMVPSAPSMRRGLDPLSEEDAPMKVISRTLKVATVFGLVAVVLGLSTSPASAQLFGRRTVVVGGPAYVMPGPYVPTTYVAPAPAVVSTPVQAVYAPPVVASPPVAAGYTTTTCGSP